ncbi:MAG: hypothetical protein V1861_06950, partial [Candidatus Micrarchaeota archaeon]
DMGWVTSGGSITREEVEEYVRDYHSNRFQVVNGTFDEFFTTNQTFRKDTNITRFDYFVITGGLDVRPPSTELVLNHSGILVYEAAAD